MKNPNSGSKNWYFAAAIMLLFCGPAAAAEDKPVPAEDKYEIGITLGYPTGASGKYFLSPKEALDGTLGFGSDFMMHFDYLWHDFLALKVSEGRMPFYYGAGFLLTSKTGHFYAQGKIGFEYMFDTNPLGLFLEAAPAFGLDFIFQGGIGVRYRLK